MQSEINGLFEDINTELELHDYYKNRNLYIMILYINLIRLLKKLL